MTAGLRQSLAVTAALTALALIAFAANSVLTRLALAPGLIEADRFAALRVLSGAITLWLIVALRSRAPGVARARPGLAPALALALYLCGFTLAYASLETGTGALILFGSVQATMIGWGLLSGERLPLLGWSGLAIAITGLAVQLLPGAGAADPVGAVLMVAAGIGWGWYSLIGRGVSDALGATAWNFTLAAPLVLAMEPLMADRAFEPEGALFAIASGALASGLGYALWFRALPHLTALRAAAVQLAVPAIAAVGGVILLSEPVTLRLAIAATATLGGVGMVLAARAARSESR
ncbi:MAG: DMT family transporter [Pseudomonadota bacterium]